MRGVLGAAASMLLGGLLTMAQAPTAITSPPDGHAFVDGEQVCLSQSSSPSGMVSWTIDSPLGSGILLSPSLAGLDNGHCLPHGLLTTDPSMAFSLTCRGRSAGESRVDCTLAPSGTGSSPDPLTLREVSFRRRGQKYFLRVVTTDPIAGLSCLSLALGGHPLAIGRLRPSGTGTLVEAEIGHEDDFVRIASNTPELQLEDHCAQRVFTTPPLPPGKLSSIMAYVVYIQREGKVRMVGTFWTPLTGCEVVFYSWYDASQGTWAVQEFPTYLKYTANHGPEGYLPPSHRKVWRPGILLWRSYDYCTGEYTGFGLGGVTEAEWTESTKAGAPGIALVAEDSEPIE